MTRPPGCALVAQASTRRHRQVRTVKGEGNWMRRKRVMRNTSEWREVTSTCRTWRRDLRRGRPRPNQHSRSVANPGKQFPVAVASLHPGRRFVLPPSAESLLRFGRWWHQSVPSGRFKTDHTKLLLRHTEPQFRHTTRAETRPRPLHWEAISPTCPTLKPKPEP